MSTTASSPEAAQDADRDLTPEERELHWFQNVYQGDSMPQLTVRSVIMGSILGAVRCIFHGCHFDDVKERSRQHWSRATSARKKRGEGS